MKKYFYIYKATLIENLNYVFDLVFAFFNYFVMMFIFMNLWQYVYQDSSQLISGYSMNQMIWYVIITECLWFGTRNRILTDQISEDVKSGNVAYNINKPYNYVYYVMAKHLGDITIKFFLFIIVSIVTGFCFVGPIPNFNLANMPFIVITVILGIFINSLLRIAISLISFWIEDSRPFQWVYDKLILVIGTLFPVEMFPAFLRPIIKCTPIFVISYGPAKLLIDFTYEKFIHILLAQIIYLIIAIGLNILLFKKGAKKLNVNGG